MKWYAAVLLGSLALPALASPPDAGTPAATRKKSTPKSTPKSAPAAGLPLTLELLDRYIQYRRESDAATLSENDALLQKAQEGGAITYDQLRKMMERDQAVRAKYGLSGDGFQALDQMVRNISEARFKAESATAKTALKNLEAQANGPPGPERDMARSMMGYWQKDLQVDPTLHREREAYGDAAVDLVLQREAELKELWIAKDAATSKALGTLPTAPPAPKP